MTSLHNQHIISVRHTPLRRIFRTLPYGIIILLFFLYFDNNVNGQVQATGHVFAEIVETTALTAKANNNHFISSQNRTSDSDMVLAEVKVSGTDVNIGVSVQSGSLQSANGETMLFTAYARPRCATSDSPSLPGESLFTFKGTPGETAQLHTNSTFNGQYRVTFMYD